MINKANFSKCVARLLDTLEMVGMKDERAKQMVKGHVWDLYDALNKQANQNESKENNNGDTRNRTQEFLV